MKEYLVEIINKVDKKRKFMLSSEPTKSLARKDVYKGLYWYFGEKNEFKVRKAYLLNKEIKLRENIYCTQYSNNIVVNYDDAYFL